MPRIPEAPLPAQDPLTRELFEAQEREHGFVFNTSRIYGRRPTVMRGINQLQEGINASGLLDPALKAMVCVRVAQLNGCPFWVDINSSRGMSNGLDWEKLEALEGYASDPRFAPRERAALEFAERMTRTDLDLDDACFARARAEFSDDELVELAAVAAMENFRSKFNNAFRIEAQGFCAMKKK